jgi:signal transduction histidine kinase
MDTSADSPAVRAVAESVASRLHDARFELTARWLERIVARVTLDANRVFPTDALLDHMPLLVDGIADFIGAGDPPNAQPVVIDRARELGVLRFQQGFSEHELQKEYEILGGILLTFVRRVTEEAESPVGVDEALGVAHRVFQSVAQIQQATTSEFLRHVTGELREREERLNAFHRALTHEMRNQLGATLGASQLLTLAGLGEVDRDRLAGVIARNAESMRAMLDNLLELARIRLAPRQQRNVKLPEVAAEAARQLRDMAEHHRVNVRVLPDLPRVDVNAAAVELCLANLISNGIKYADPSASERWVEIRGRFADGEVDPRMLGKADDTRHVVIEVADNGLGVPADSRPELFQRFFRAHETEHAHVPGTGLGLSIIRETVESFGGRAWAEFPDAGGSVFAFSLPSRRAEDVVALQAQTTVMKP